MTKTCIVLLSLLLVVAAGYAQEQESSKEHKMFTVCGKIVYKPWTKSMESYMAGGSDYFILDVKGFKNEDVPKFSGVIYLRPSAQVTFEELKKYTNKNVEIRGIHDVPRRKAAKPKTPNGNEPIEQKPAEPRLFIEQKPVTISPDGRRETSEPGMGEGVEVREIRLLIAGMEWKEALEVVIQENAELRRKLADLQQRLEALEKSKK